MKLISYCLVKLFHFDFFISKIIQITFNFGVRKVKTLSKSSILISIIHIGININFSNSKNHFKFSYSQIIETRLVKNNIQIRICLQEGFITSVFIISKEASLIYSIITLFKNYVEISVKNQEKITRKYKQFFNQIFRPIQKSLLNLFVFKTFDNSHPP
jgi:hypothetical protein